MDEGKDTITTVIFQGIASVDVGDHMYDVALTARTEYHGYVVRWFGTFEWMGERPTDFKPGGFFDLTLSDGREARIRVPHWSAQENGALEFLGVGLPPGFEVFTPQHMQTTELKSSTPFLSRVMSFWSLLLALVGIYCLVQSIWADTDQWRWFGSSIFAAFVSLCFSAAASNRAGKLARMYAEGGEIHERGDDDSEA